MKILVSGGAGFIGSNLCEELVKEKSNKVFSLDNYFTGKVENHVDGVDYIKGDTKDIFELIQFKPELIYHLGEYARVEQSFDDLEKVFEYNKLGTYKVLEYARKTNAKLVYAGSSTKFGDGGQNALASPYAWSKASNTDLVKNYASVWGWATWKDRWLKYDVTLFDWRRDFSETDVLNTTGSKFFTKILKNDFDSIVENKIDTWDIQLQYALLKEKCFCVFPRKNLIRNIGFVGHHSTGRTKAHSKSSFEKFDFKKVKKLRRSISFKIFKYVDFKISILKSKLYKIFKKL